MEIKSKRKNEKITAKPSNGKTKDIMIIADIVSEQYDRALKDLVHR